MAVEVDPFHAARYDPGIVEAAYDGEHVPLLLRYRDLRDAAHDWQRYSSDAPARLTLPDETAARSLRQLPIETDPPSHTAYRDLVEAYYRRPLRAEYGARISDLVARIIGRACALDVCDAVSDVAQPRQSQALAVLLGLPQSYADEWVGWGLHPFKTEGRSDPVRAARLERHIEHLIDRAIEAPGEDLASVLLRADFQCRKLSCSEIAGYLHVAFAGGRDTIINTISGVLDHFARHPDDMAALRCDPKLVATAAEEFVRYLSPLTHIGRVCNEATNVGGRRHAPGDRIGLCFAAANFDPSVFPAPQELRLSRSPNPHVGYGSGPHRCLGSAHARVLLRTLLSELPRRIERVDLVARRNGQRSFGGFVRPHGYELLHVRFVPRATFANPL